IKLPIDCEVEAAGRDIAGSATQRLILPRGNCADGDRQRQLEATRRAPLLIPFLRLRRGHTNSMDAHKGTRRRPRFLNKAWQSEPNVSCPKGLENRHFLPLADVKEAINRPILL